MDDISRRAFNAQTLGSLLAWSLLETFSRNNLFADEVKPITTKWLRDVDELARQVRDQELRQVEWQAKVEELFAKVDLHDLLKMIEFDAVTKNVKLLDKGALSLRAKFPHVEGLPTKFVFGTQIFALKKGRSVIPHGHNNMATAFLILKGELRGRHYDRIEDLGDHLIIKPTLDKTFSVGGCSTVSDYKDNVHWFQALSDEAYIFNIHVYHVTPGSGYGPERIYLNPEGEKLAGGLIRAPRMEHEDLLRIYG
ncbi:MAG: hypothetical protein WD648_06390 [Planctomycetaceae bacterium]